jgi:LDH2 family malate/lactate/ureidoglycolate dehydrogenase
MKTPAEGAEADRRGVVVVPHQWLDGVVRGIFRALGFSEDAARAIAEALVDADLRGISSHGTMLAPIYAERVQRGAVSRRETFDIVVDGGAVAVLDAGHGMGQLSACRAMEMAVERARSHGVGAVGVRRAHHFGAAGRYALQAAAAGCIGVACSNTTPLMPAPGGARRIVGNNPVAVAVPAGDRPLLLDMALSEVALNRIRLADQAGQPIPETWATDARGVPTTDPRAAIEGMLLPAGGHKGFGLALMIEVLTGLLAGGGRGVRSLYRDRDLPNDCSHFFLALDVAHFTEPKTFQRRTAELADEVRGSPRAPGAAAVHAPGDRQAERRRRQLSQGVEIGRSVVDELLGCARRLGLAAAPPGASPPGAPAAGASGG